MIKKKSNVFQLPRSLAIGFPKFPHLVLWCHAFDVRLGFLKGRRMDGIPFNILNNKKIHI